MATEAQRATFRLALQKARNEAQMSQRELATAVGVSPGTIAQWETGDTAPRADRTIELEGALGIEGGLFSRLLGYLPVGPQETAVMSVLEAIEADPRLGDRERELLAAMYRQLVRQRRKATSEAKR